MVKTRKKVDREAGMLLKEAALAVTARPSEAGHTVEERTRRAVHQATPMIKEVLLVKEEMQKEVRQVDVDQTIKEVSREVTMIEDVLAVEVRVAMPSKEVDHVVEMMQRGIAQAVVVL